MMDRFFNLKVLEKLFSFFPCFHFLLLFSNLIYFIQNPKMNFLLFLIFNIYILPLLIWRSLFLKVKEGKQPVGVKAKRGSAWLIAHYLQYNFIAFTFFEKVLFVIPGAYSFWLKCWGSKIGKSVVWNPVMNIHDRSLVEVGDFTIIGGHTNIACHFLVRNKNILNVYVKKVIIGKKVMIGAKTSIGPGTHLIDATFLPAHSRCLLGRIERGEFGKTDRT